MWGQVGSVAGAVILAGLAYWFWRKKRNAAKPTISDDPIKTGKEARVENSSGDTLPR